jgi:hypothetical protein
VLDAFQPYNLNCTEPVAVTLNDPLLPLQDVEFVPVAILLLNPSTEERRAKFCGPVPDRRLLILNPVKSAEYPGSTVIENWTYSPVLMLEALFQFEGETAFPLQETKLDVPDNPTNEALEMERFGSELDEFDP